MTAPEHQHAAEELGVQRLVESDVLNRDATVRQEAKHVETTKCSRVLVLLTDGLAENVDLDVTRLLGELTGRDALTAVGVESVQQADGEGARASEPGGCRNI